MIEKTGINPIILTAAGGFSASITMNADDAMVFVSIDHLPNSPSGYRLAILQELATYLKDDIGAKIIINLPAEALADAVEAKLSVHTDKIEIIDVATLETAIKKLHEKDNVQQALKKYKLVHDDKLVAYSKRLDQFKRKPGNAAFVTADKQKQGLYSDEAEWRKNNNPFVRQLSLEDQNGEIVGVLMVAFDKGHKMAYVSDYIVAQDKRDVKGDHTSGIAQALAYHAFTTLHQECPQLKKVCFIEGVDPSVQQAQEKLYRKIFQTRSAAEVNNETPHTTVAMFGPPKKLVLTAAHRSSDAKTTPPNLRERLSDVRYFDAELKESEKKQVRFRGISGSQFAGFPSPKPISPDISEENLGQAGLQVLQEVMRPK